MYEGGQKTTTSYVLFRPGRLAAGGGRADQKHPDKQKLNVADEIHKFT